MSFFTHDFYILNTAQHFSFPHSDCDEISNIDLTAWFYKPDYFCFYILKYYKPDATLVDLARIQSPFMSTFGSAWMRLKFAAEVMDPVYVTRRIEPRAFKRSPFTPYTLWKTEADSRGSSIDNLANYVLNHIIKNIEAYVRNIESTIYTNDVDMISALQTMNSAIYTIRKTPCDGKFMWSGTHPRDLTIFPYFAFITQMWEAIAPVLTILCDP